MKKILALYPAFSKQGFLNAHEIISLTGGKYDSPPLGLLTALAMLPDEWPIRFVDLNVREIDDEVIEWSDIVFISSMLYQQASAVRWIESCQKAGKKVAIGGPDPTFQPQFYGQADYVVVGEAESVMLEVVSDMETGITRGIYQSEIRPDIEKSPAPRYDLVDFDDYFRVGVQCTRGCPHDCEFCSITKFYGSKPRIKTTEQVIRELEAIYDTGYNGGIDFTDDNYICNKTEAKRRLRAIVEWSRERNHPFYFHTQVPIRIADDDEILCLMRDAGFESLLVGIETVDDEVLKRANKSHNASRDLVGDLKKIYDHGIAVIGTYIVGFDNEPADIADKIIENIEEGHVWFPAVFQLYAAPFTALGRRLLEEGRLYGEKNTTHFVSDDDLIDLVSSGINFVTDRPRADVVRDYAKILETVFEKRKYFDRCLALCLRLQRKRRFRPNRKTQKRFLGAVVTIIRKVGFSRETGWLFWRNFLMVLFRNPAALFDLLYQMGYFLHFEKRSALSVSLLREIVEEIEFAGEDSFNRERLDPLMSSPVLQKV